MSLTKQDIANALVKKTDLTQTQALVVTNQFFEQIIETLSKGENVKLSSFGNFVVTKASQEYVEKYFIPSVDEITIKRAWHSTSCILKKAQALCKTTIIQSNRPHDDIGVAIHVFGHRIIRNISSLFQRALKKM